MKPRADSNRRRLLGSLGALGATLAAPGLAVASFSDTMSTNTETPDLILHNGRFTTLDRANPVAEAVAIKDGRFTRVGRAEEVLPLAGGATRVIDLQGRRVLPGLIDNHLHIIRGGLNYNMELRWDGVRSLADAMGMLKRRWRSRPRRSGCAWWAASPSTSSPRSACRPSKS